MARAAAAEPGADTRDVLAIGQISAQLAHALADQEPSQGSRAHPGAAGWLLGAIAQHDPATRARVILPEPGHARQAGGGHGDPAWDSLRVVRAGAV